MISITQFITLIMILILMFGDVHGMLESLKKFYNQTKSKYKDKNSK